MLALDRLRGDGGDFSSDIEPLSALTLWKRNFKRELARRHGVDKSRIRIETERTGGEVVLHARIDR
jgi:hypothetical protein